MNHILRNTPCNQFMDKNQEHVVVYTTLKINILTFSIIVFTCFLLYATFGAANPTLGYNAKNFHWWQLLTAHLIHYDFKHLSLNMLALLILLYLFPTNTKKLINGFMLAIFLIDIYLIFSDVHYYIGFSGLLYVIPGVAFAQLIMNKQYFYVLLIFGAFIIYTTLSFFTINMSESNVWTPSIPAHLLGLISGILIKIKY